MHRRLFARLLAAGAGSLPLLSLTGAAGLAGEAAEKKEKQPAAGGTPAVDENPADENRSRPSGSRNPSRRKPRVESLDDVVNVDDMRKLASSTVSRPTYEYITTGSEDGLTLRANVAAFRQVQLMPPLLHGVAEPDLSTTVLGQKLSLPILLAPVAAQRMFHPEGGLAAARAAAKAGTIFGVSSSVGHSVEQVAAASAGPKWYQLYLPRDRNVARQLVQRVEQSGYKALVVTVDLGERKDSDRRNRFTLPRPLMLEHLQNIGFPGINDKMTDEELNAFNSTAWEPALSWEVFAWLRKITRLPLLIKGVLSVADARRAVELGLDGIIVSNHGGRRLDGVPASLDCLPAITAAVGNQTEILVDSGIRRGGDALKAIAMGARAVLVGRPYAWGLCAGGEAGVSHVLELLRGELTNAMLACGCQRVQDISPDLLHRAPGPTGFGG